MPFCKTNILIPTDNSLNDLPQNMKKTHFFRLGPLSKLPAQIIILTLKGNV